MLEVYYFLFALAFFWIVFACVTDLKKEEVPDWLSYSFIIFALAYRAFYAILYNEPRFFFFGVIGCLVFVALGFAFYYGRVFGGGDAKLLMGIGAVLPFENMFGFFSNSFLFLMSLFLLGGIYTLFYSIGLCIKYYSRFKQTFIKKFLRYNMFFYTLGVIYIIVLFWYFFYPNFYLIYLIYVLPLSALLLFLHCYLKSIEEGCLIRLEKPKNLTEGDWLFESVRVRGRTIEKTVHGLSLKDIAFLKSAKKEVLIKHGIPFVPSFLLALLTVFFFLIFEFSLEEFFGFLS